MASNGDGVGSRAFDPAGFDYWSPELFRMHGLDPARKPPTVQEYLDYIHPQDRESMANLLKGRSARTLPFDVTKRIVRPDGKVRYIRCVGVPGCEPHEAIVVLQNLIYFYLRYSLGSGETYKSVVRAIDGG